MRVKILDWLTFSGDVTAARAEFDTGGRCRSAPLTDVSRRPDRPPAVGTFVQSGHALPG